MREIPVGSEILKPMNESLVHNPKEKNMCLSMQLLSVHANKGEKVLNEMQERFAALDG